jgi:hypothetical protein
MNPSTSSKKPALLAIATLGGLGLLWWAVQVWRGTDANEKKESHRSNLDDASIAGVPADPLATARDAAFAAKEPAEKLRTLKSLRAVLRGMQPAAASKWLRGQLAEGKDFATGLEMEITPERTLAQWPSWRVFLLDSLLAVDPSAAVAAARGIVQSGGTQEEWAVSLRNIALGSQAPEDGALLRQKSAEMLHNAAWRAAPTTGYLEAFDLIVHTRNTDLAPWLLDLCADQANRATRHAAFLTLDRLMLVAPEPALRILVPAASSRSDLGLMLSNMIARADVANAAQRQWVETYLLDEKRTAAELKGFWDTFPNGNFRISNNLVTESAVISPEEMTHRDREAVVVIESWSNDPRFSRLKDALQTAKQRLAAASNSRTPVGQ